MTQTLAPRKQLVTVEAAAAYAGVHVRSMRRYIGEGRIPAYRVGDRLLRIDLNEVDTILLRQIPTTGPHHAYANTA